jgi:hypothetical protein
MLAIVRRKLRHGVQLLNASNTRSTGAAGLWQPSQLHQL